MAVYKFPLVSKILAYSSNVEKNPPDPTNKLYFLSTVEKKKSQVKKYYRVRYHIKYLLPREADGGGRKWMRKGGQYLFTPWIKLSLYWWEVATVGKSNRKRRGRE